MNDREFRDEFPMIIQKFATYKDVVQGCSKKTVTEYLFDLRTFSKFLVAEREKLTTDEESFEKIDIRGLTPDFYESVTTTEIYDFLSYVKNGRENQSGTRARKLSAIKQFYKYCTVKQMLFENNPAANIEAPKTKKQLPKHLSVDECVELLEAVNADPESRSKERDFCILTIFLNCGLRLSELCGININDLDDELRSMRVVGKGSKERLVYLNDACRSAIEAYIPVRIAAKPKREGENALFLSRFGLRISVKTVQWMVKKYLGEAGLEYKNYSTHKLRHTAATLMYQSGKVDIRVLKDILGHEQLNTTQIYTHVSDAHMEEAMASNPLASIKPSKSADFKRINDDSDESE